MTKEGGSVLGGMLLIAGSCIGAGMLGLPIVTGLSGFFPSLGMFFLGWLFMTATALLLVEVNGWFKDKVNLLSMTSCFLGRWGKAVCWTTYLFLFYALLVAYLSGIGSLFSSFFASTFQRHLPDWVGSLFFVLLFGWVVYFGTRKVDLLNRGLMVGKISFFVLLVLLGVKYVQPQLLLRTNPSYALSALPLLVISFGFHNMIPSLTHYLKGDLKKVRTTILGGSLMVLGIYLIWEIFILGVIPFEGANGLKESLKQDREASQAIAAIIGSSWVKSFAQGFAFFAILTSFLAQALSLVHFLADGLKISYKKGENVFLCLLALVPPLLFSSLYPQLFFKALNFAGGICAVILFGILPALMAWKGRQKRSSSYKHEMRGGKLTLCAILFFAGFILIVQTAQMLHLF